MSCFLLDFGGKDVAGMMFFVGLGGGKVRDRGCSMLNQAVMKTIENGLGLMND
jgi:hypothetical protein